MLCGVGPNPTIRCLARTPPRKKVSSQSSKLLTTNLTLIHQLRAIEVAKILGVAQVESSEKTKNLGHHIIIVLEYNLRIKGFSQNQNQVL